MITLIITFGGIFILACAAEWLLEKWVAKRLGRPTKKRWLG